jgi:hypothetical protein
MIKKILVISPVCSHPTIQGNRTRIYRLLLNLKQMGHEVYFLYVNTEPVDEKLMQEFWSDKFYVAPYQTPHRTLIKRIFRKLKSFFVKESAFIYLIDDWYDNSLNIFIISLSRKINFDVVIVEYVFFSKALECFGDNVLKIIDTHDIYTNRHKIYLRNNQRPHWYSTTAKEEAKGLNRADVIIAIQQKEKEFFSQLTNQKVITVGHTVPLYKPVQNLSNNKTILFLGANNPMNVHGINYFIKNVFPQIKLYFPTIQLLLAGSVCDEVEDFDSCIKVGELENLENIYSMADLAINPALFGTGLKIKTIEALGYSKPLVTTSIGAEGLEDGINKAFLVADAPEDFSLSIIKILSDSRVFDSLCKNAYDFAKRWNEESLRELANILD